AVALAQKNVADEMSPQFAGIISGLWSSDPQAAGTLAQSVVAALGRSSAPDQRQNIYSALSLLSTLANLEESGQSQRQNDRTPRPSLRASAQAVADFLATQALVSGNQEIVFPQLLYGSDQLEKYAPAKFAKVKERLAEWQQQHPEAVSNMELNKMLPNSNLDEQLEAAARAPSRYREQ